MLGDISEAAVDYLGGEFTLRVKRHRRIKVLSEAGYDLGEFAFRYSGENAKVRGVQGQTFVPQPDGSYKEVRLEKDAIFNEEVREGVRESRFSMPALAPGVILEFEYEYVTENIFSPPTWYFQSSEPTLYSRYSLASPSFFRYVAHRQGGAIETQETQNGKGRHGMDEAIWTWKAENVPALREEPYTTTEEDYTLKIETQLSRIEYLNGEVQQVLSTWDAVAKDLDENTRFGRRMYARGNLRDIAASVTGTPEERTRGLYNLVREQYVWNGRRSIFAERDLREVAQAKSGTSGEINQLLIALLREADIPADPVLISTRDNGQVYEQYPLVNRFNHMLVFARPEGGASQLLDATDPHRPYGILPVEALVGKGWIPTPRIASWVEFGASDATLTMTSMQGTLAPDGTLTGTMGVRLAGYDALRVRTRLSEEASEAPTASAREASGEAAAEAADAEDSLDLKEVLIEGLDDIEEPILFRAQASSAAGDVVGDEMYLTPFVAMRMEENPFKQAERAFPVDFAYPFRRAYVSSITLPEGFAPEAIPDPVVLAIPSRSVTYTRRYAHSPGQLQINAVLNVAASSISPEEYSALRTLYDEIVAVESEALVLVRTPLAPEAVPETPVTGDAPETSGEEGQ